MRCGRKGAGYGLDGEEKFYLQNISDYNYIPCSAKIRTCVKHLYPYHSSGVCVVITRNIFANAQVDTVGFDYSNPCISAQARS